VTYIAAASLARSSTEQLYIDLDEARTAVFTDARQRLREINAIVREIERRSIIIVPVPWHPYTPRTLIMRGIIAA
jgi:hypothetical protein